MALTVGEANAVNHVLDFILGNKRDIRITPELARDSAILLADHAHKTLSAGLTGADVAQTQVWRQKADGYRRVVRALRQKGGA